MATTHTRSTVVTILSALASIVFLGAGAAKLLGAADAVANFTRFGLSTSFMYFIGVAEVAGAIGLFLPRLAPLAATGLALIMGGATTEHLLHDPLGDALPPLVLFVLCTFLAYSRRGELFD